MQQFFGIDTIYSTESSIDTLKISSLFIFFTLLQPVVSTGFKGERLVANAAYSPPLSTRHHILDLINISSYLFTHVNANLRQHLAVSC